MVVVKRDGRKEQFNKEKIVNAILKAMKNSAIIHKDVAQKIADRIEKFSKEKKEIKISEIESLVFSYLIEYGESLTARAYEGYRSIREFQRNNSSVIDKQVEELLNRKNEYWNDENSNKDANLVTTQRDYLAGIVSTDITRRFLLPPEIVQAHDEGVIHFHDADYFGQLVLHNCELVNLDDMLQNGTVINGVMIEKPHKFLTAATIATQIILAVTSSSYGGCTVSLSHLAPFVRESYKGYLKSYLEFGLEKEVAEKLSREATKKEIKAGVQTFNYQVNSMTNSNGQAPFLSVFMYLGETEEYKQELADIIEEFLNQRILGFKNEKGVYITPAFPKLLYVLEKDNIEPGSRFFYLTKLAAECTAKRMVPDYISEKVMKENKINQFGDGDCYGCMGCRSFLTPWRTKGNPAKALNFEEGKGKYYGRFNQGVVTINLPDVAFSSKGDMNAFWDILEERAELCHKALKIRHERLKLATSDIAPILWQHGALARLDKGESIVNLLKDGYSTISLGYAGLYETVKFLTGHSHSEGGEYEALGLKIMQFLNDKCNQWKAEENIDYSVYGSPIESTTYKFAKTLKKRFGEDIFEKLDGKDRNYITNSYHIAVFEEVDPFEKLEIESKFQKLSPGGAISYIESANLTQNTEAVLKVLQFIYNHIMYAEINTKSDYCQKCGYDGEIQIIDDGGKLIWECPNCGNRDKNTMNVTRRTCGYLGTNFWNQGRTQEIKDRFVHLDNHEV